MSWENSEIMTEFMKIAADNDMLGLKKTALPEGNPYQEDVNTIKEKRLKEEEEHVMEKAHPEPVYIAESQGDGALVENNIEQQKKLVEMLNKHPTGSLVGRYAYTVTKLVKMAEAAEEIGEPQMADTLTDTAKQIVDQMSDTVEDMTSTVDDIDAELQKLIQEHADEFFPFVEAPTESDK